MTLTPTQQRLMEVLKDGQPHTREELFGEAIDDEMSNSNNLNMHITLLRKKLQAQGMNVVAEGRLDSTRFRLVRHIDTSE